MTSIIKCGQATLAGYPGAANPRLGASRCGRRGYRGSGQRWRRPVESCTAAISYSGSHGIVINIPAQNIPHTGPGHAPALPCPALPPDVTHPLCSPSLHYPLSCTSLWPHSLTLAIAFCLTLLLITVFLLHTATTHTSD